MATTFIAHFQLFFILDTLFSGIITICRLAKKQNTDRQTDRQTDTKTTTRSTETEKLKEHGNVGFN